MSPDHRHHRGTHPSDDHLFSDDALPTLRLAASELAWLLTRGYKMNSSLKLVGDRHALRERQRLALSRAGCSDQQKETRSNKRLPLESIGGADVFIDGFNLIITFEAALSGGVLLLCRDECVRDLSSVHGSYRSVVETESAIRLTEDAVARLAPRSVTWLLDKPISNSGRLAQKIRDESAPSSFSKRVEVVFNPDAVLRESRGIVLTSDSVVLDHAANWVNFVRHVLDERFPGVRLVDLNV